MVLEWPGGDLPSADHLAMAQQGQTFTLEGVSVRTGNINTVDLLGFIGQTGFSKLWHHALEA